ncbi:hypothetical protein HPB47_022915 [Ixodes persulcatus]|uniref:Uncharacterized protein n=1 Tax=Ixodes persulcatus TaxID=34615 RepID=A0AC60QBJ2_IXOPE|nr:hypothetical protein HPB47_022915 [Ixodes persulcatus]
MRVPVRIKLGIGQFLTTTTLKKGSGMGSGVSLKAEKLVIDDVQVLEHPREVVRKLGLQRLQQFGQEGVRVHAKTVRGIFSGGRPELSVAGAKFTQNALDYILQLPILLLHPGEVTAKLQFKYTNRHITSWMPVRIKLGFVKFLATVAVKKATGMGSWVGLKATKIFIQKYSVTSGADYWILKKMGRRAVNQLVKEMMKTKFLEDALTFYLTKLWRRMAFPVFNVRG